MALTIANDPPLLRADEHGRVWVAGTRVFLDLIVHAYRGGMTPEQIAERFDAIRLADVYGALGYYLRHQAELDVHFSRMDAEADALEAEIRANQKPFPTRAELLTRRAALAPVES